MKSAMLVLVLCLLSGCAVLTAQIPLGAAPGSPVATVTSWRIWINTEVTASLPGGLSLTYSSQPNPNGPFMAAWMTMSSKAMSNMIDSASAAANSPAGQAAIKAYSGGGGLPTAVIPVVPVVPAQ